MAAANDAARSARPSSSSHHITRVERFSQSIGDSPFSEIEFAIPGDSVDAQVVNDAVGRFALWGFPDVSDRKLLPAAAKASDQDK